MGIKVKLFIDDIRDPPNDNIEGFIVLRDYDEAISWMRKNGCPQMISFDHDLASFRRQNGKLIEYTGYDIAKWMVERDLNANGKWLSKEFSYNVHSANPIGTANINGLLTGYLESRKGE